MRSSTTAALPLSIALPRARRPAIGDVSTLSISLVAEVAAADGVVGPELGARAGEDHASGLEHVAGVGGLQREVRVLLDYQDGQAFLLVQLADDPEELRDEDGCEPERRLVQQKKPRPEHERARERQHLLLAAAQRPGLLLAPLRQPGEVREDPLELGLDRAAARIGAEAEVLRDCQLRERAAPLGHVRDAEA